MRFEFNSSGISGLALEAQPKRHVIYDGKYQIRTSFDAACARCQCARCQPAVGPSSTLLNLGHSLLRVPRRRLCTLRNPQNMTPSPPLFRFVLVSATVVARHVQPAAKRARLCQGGDG